MEKNVFNLVCCLELCMVGEARQREEQTQFAVVVFGGAELLQGVQTLHSLLHGELQLGTQGRGESESRFGSWKGDRQS